MADGVEPGLGINHTAAGEDEIEVLSGREDGEEREQ